MPGIPFAPSANPSPRSLKEMVGRPLASGGEASIYLHARDSNKVIKVFRAEVCQGDRRNELETLNKYYGKTFAVSDGASISMKRIAGTPLHKIPPRSLAASAMIELQQVLERFQNLGIWPTDLCEANFIYDASQGRIFPIDLKDAQLNHRSRDELERYAESYRSGVAYLRRVILDKIRPDAPSGR